MCNSATKEEVKFWGQKVDEHTLFDWKERKVILQKTKGHCACCGKKLTTSTMTVEHCVPISRGGQNILSNMVALCYDCNKRKGNLFYLPGNYYVWMSASADKDVKRNFAILSEYGYNWMKENKAGFNFEKYPLVSPTDVALLSIRTPSGVFFSASNVIDIMVLNAERWATVEGVTGLKKEEVLNELGKDIQWSFYMYEQRSTKKIIAVTAVCYNNGGLQCHVLWNDCKPATIEALYKTFLREFTFFYTTIEQELTHIIFGHYDSNFFQNAQAWGWTYCSCVPFKITYRDVMMPNNIIVASFEGFSRFEFFKNRIPFYNKEADF